MSQGTVIEDTASFDSFQERDPRKITVDGYLVLINCLGDVMGKGVRDPVWSSAGQMQVAWEIANAEPGQLIAGPPNRCRKDDGGLCRRSLQVHEEASR